MPGSFSGVTRVLFESVPFCHGCLQIGRKGHHTSVQGKPFQAKASGLIASLVCDPRPWMHAAISGLQSTAAVAASASFNYRRLWLLSACAYNAGSQRTMCLTKRCAYTGVCPCPLLTTLPICGPTLRQQISKQD